MKKITTVFFKGMAFLCAFSANLVNAGEALDSINAEVEQKAQTIDQKYGVLLTTQERNELKISLVVKKVTADAAKNTSKTVEQKTNEAITTYEVTDPTDQRKLLIEIEAASFNGSGNKPPCCG